MIVTLRHNSARHLSSKGTLCVLRPAFATRSGCTIPTKRTLSSVAEPDVGAPKTSETSRDLFNFTSRRFVTRGKGEFRNRHAAFRVGALMKRAAQAVGAHHATDIKKTVDGKYFKTYTITLDDGGEVLAKLPNARLVKHPHVLTSEAATSSFVRMFCNVPAPRPLRVVTDDGSVGQPYMLMRKPPGVLLSSIWEGLPDAQKANVLEAIASFQLRWSRIRFDGYGSLYNKKDSILEKGHIEMSPAESARLIDYLIERRQEAKTYGRFSDADSFRSLFDRFAVGITALQDSKGSQLDDSGPWRKSSQYLKGTLSRIRNDRRYWKVPLLRDHSLLAGPNTYRTSHTEKIKAANAFRSLFPYIVPDRDSELLKATLWNPNITADDIYVDPEAPEKIKSFVNWQFSVIAPAYRQGSQPPFFSGASRSDEATHVSHPSKDKSGLLREPTFMDLYTMLVKKQPSAIRSLLAFQQTPEYKLLSLAPNLVKGGELDFLKAVWEYTRTNPAVQLMLNQERMIKRGSGLIPNPEDEENLARQDRGREALRMVHTATGNLLDDDWSVAPEHYEAVKRVLKSVKHQVIDRFSNTEEDKAAWEEAWPFEDE